MPPELHPCKAKRAERIFEFLEHEVYRCSRKGSASDMNCDYPRTSGKENTEKTASLVLPKAPDTHTLSTQLPLGNTCPHRLEKQHLKHQRLQTQLSVVNAVDEQG